MPVSSTHAATGDLPARIERAFAICGATERAIQTEDSPRSGRRKSLTVIAQLQAEYERALRLFPRAPPTEAAVHAYEEMCDTFAAAHLESLLVSTDPLRGPFQTDAGRDVLGSSGVDGKLAAWQAQDKTQPVAKFAVVRGIDGRTLEVRVGAFGVNHADIAGGPALSAGLLQTTTITGKTFIVALENTSGGFRPAPQRNRVTLQAIRAAGYLAAPPGMVVYDNPSGSYADSKLMPR